MLDIVKEAPEDMLFADDIVLSRDTKEEVEQDLEKWRQALEMRGLKISRKKIEYLCCGDGQQIQGSIQIEGNLVPRVTEFKYLGSTVQEDGSAEKEIEKRIQAGWNSWRKITGVLCDKKAPIKLKGKMFKTMVRPAMLYGTEALAVSQKQEKKLEVAEMKMLRYSLGITKLDRVRNEEVRKKLCVGEISGKMREARLRWCGHVYRREETYVGKRVGRMKIGKAKRGRPMRRWRDCVNEDLKVKDLKMEQASCRKEWRRRIRTGDPT